MQTCTCIGLYPSTYTWVCVCIFYKRAIQLKSSIFLLDAINLMTKKSIINVCVWSQVFGSMNRTLSLDSCSSIFEVSIFKHPLQSVSQPLPASTIFTCKSMNFTSLQFHHTMNEHVIHFMLHVKFLLQMLHATLSNAADTHTQLRIHIHSWWWPT